MFWAPFVRRVLVLRFGQTASIFAGGGFVWAFLLLDFCFLLWPRNFGRAKVFLQGLLVVLVICLRRPKVRVFLDL